MRVYKTQHRYYCVVDLHAMPSCVREAELTDSMWERVAPLLPPKRAQPKGGRPFADDKRCFAGIVPMLRKGLRQAVPVRRRADDPRAHHPTPSKR